MAIRLATISAASSGFLILCLALGPQSGMESLGFLIPWIVVLIVHVFLCIPALLWAWQGRPHSGFWWIYGYYFLFWGMHVYVLAEVDHLSAGVNRRLDRLLKPAETELAEWLEQARKSAYRKTAIAPEDMRRIRELVQAGKDRATVRVLLDGGASVNQSKPGRPTAMHIAAWNGDAEMMALLLAAGGNFKNPLIPT